MKALKVFQSGDHFLKIPESMGNPREDQMQGDPLEQLIELSGRICYDSLGTGRNSLDYHKHIIKVNHGSVWEHANLTFEFQSIYKKINIDILRYFINKPGIWVSMNKESSIRVTMNFRTVREWDNFYSCHSHQLGQLLQYICYEQAPMIFEDLYVSGLPLREIYRNYDLEYIKVVPPEYDEEIWISMYMQGSRGWSHEQVRHGDYTAISQRSTRYVDESESNYNWHPLINEYIKNQTEEGKVRTLDQLDQIEKITKNNYDEFVLILQEFAIQKGMTKFDARKQARGAARGILCNALSTEMIFSANLRQWKWMLKQRMNSAADGEIHEIFKQVDAIINSPKGRIINVGAEHKLGFLGEA